MFIFFHFQTGEILLSVRIDDYRMKWKPSKQIFFQCNVENFNIQQQMCLLFITYSFYRPNL